MAASAKVRAIVGLVLYSEVSAKRGIGNAPVELNVEPFKARGKYCKLFIAFWLEIATDDISGSIATGGRARMPTPSAVVG